MAKKTLDLVDVLIPDQLGTGIADKWQDWNNRRHERRRQWEELRQYLFATDTTTTSNAGLPWNNTTTTPKLCQIRDNLIANYMSSLFPRRGWMQWQGGTEKDENKRDKITKYMQHLTDEPRVKKEISKLVLDYIDYGQPFAGVEWIDERVLNEGGDKVGFVGPVPKRYSPLDIVFDPTATSFEDSPKIIRSLVSIGELKNMLTQFLPGDNADVIEGLYNYLLEIRNTVSHAGSEITDKDQMFRVDGFTDYRSYLSSHLCEVLTFFGDLYDEGNNTVKKNHMIVVVDRHKVIVDRPVESDFGIPAIYTVGWRIRQDNLWAMGPLDNLVGMQYRLDHLENLKADVLDQLAYPVQKIKGMVENYEWGPFAKIPVGDDGDVELLGPDTQILQMNLELSEIERKMEEMAGSPKESLGIRSPGEKTAFEVQRLENAAGRIFQAKILQFEELFLEQVLNAMLEMARRRMSSTTVRVIDDEFNAISFEDISRDDITAIGRIKPIGAKHFAEKAVQVQNLSQWYQSGVGSDPEVRQHISSIGLAKVSEDLLDIADFKLVTPFVRISEQADAARLANSQQEEIEAEAGTPAGLSEDDFDPEELEEDDEIGLDGPLEGEGVEGGLPQIPPQLQ
jgi:hypothetical protein